MHPLFDQRLRAGYIGYLAIDGRDMIAIAVVMWALLSLAAGAAR